MEKFSLYTKTWEMVPGLSRNRYCEWSASKWTSRHDW